MIERLRLQVPRGRMWGWMVLAAVGNVGLYMLTYVAARPVLQWLYDLWPEPAVMDRIFGDSGTFAGYPLAGNGWILGAFLVAFFFNVMGEELWWRGYVFPRQELVHSERTWLVHGLLWAAFHLFAPYNALMVLPGALFVSWIYQKQRNTWVFVAAHGALNAMAMIRLVKGVLG